ncbi:MAG: IPExxxVDY family protein [Bacteroidia bacterium]|nr:IPExxxVDY family protein [Bacteroidia bacterium]
MAKHVLQNSDDEIDFALIGLSCSENQYVVASLIDRTLNISLRLSDNIPFALKDSKLFHFSLYHFLDEEIGLEYFFISNSSNFEALGDMDTSPNAGGSANDLFAGVEIDESVKLIKELPKTDYFLILKGEDLHNYQYKIIHRLKTLPEIIQIQAIEPIDLPSRRNLIF